MHTPIRIARPSGTHANAVESPAAYTPQMKSINKFIITVSVLKTHSPAFAHTHTHTATFIYDCFICVFSFDLSDSEARFVVPAARAAYIFGPLVLFMGPFLGV